MVGAVRIDSNFKLRFVACESKRDSYFEIFCSTYFCIYVCKHWFWV